MSRPATRGWRLICAGVLAGLLSADFCARADWLVHSSARQKGSPNESVEHWKVELKNPDSTEQVTLHLAVFASRNATLKVIDQPEAPRRDLADVMTETKSLAGVNGGYFDPDDAPVGLLVCAGRVISPLRKAKLLSGVLAVTAKQVDIVRATNFQRRDRITFALQCGPLLLERATPVAGLNDTRQARRTFAAVDGNGRAALGVSSTVSLAQLGKILSLPDLGGKMKFVRALNLDGGSSTAFWFGGKDEAYSIREAKSVRDFVAIVPR